MMTADDLILRQEQYESDRSVWESYWQACADYGMPNQNQITRKDAAGSAKPDLFDTTAEDANIQLAAGLYSYMFPTDSRAFVLQIDDSDLNEQDDVKQWLDKTTAAIHKYLIHSNFRKEYFKFLKSLGCFGTACLYEEKGRNSPLSFICHHMSSIYVDIDEDGEYDTVFRSFEYTARQALQKFKKYKDTLGDKVLESANDPKRQQDKYRFIHAVMPREEADKDKDDPKSMPFASYWINRDEKCIIYESGYPEMPYQVTTFDQDPNEILGRSPMMKCLPDIKMLNRMQKTRIKGWEKQTDPPVILPDDGSIWPLATQPGGVIYKRAGGDDPTWFEFKGDLREMEAAILTVQKKVKTGFFLDMFDPLVDRQNMTATETVARVEQKIRFLIHIVGGLQSGQSNPMIHRIIGVLGRQNLLPAPPPQLEKAEYSVMYLGRLALALKTLETEGLSKTFAEWGPMAEAGRVEWLDNLDSDMAFRDSARNNGTPATWLTSVKDRDALRQARAQQQQMMATITAAEQASKATKNLSKTAEEGSPMQGLMGKNA